ncbi:NAD(P)/FAD-dependent oxidoreductase [Georgenia yuyongxinii]|uniref:NAD(P)/FAD-dependent oxidoreductase n=1 Tax=Georgenia yuyongxinii TaxID=2589797 RepID=A0A5B8C6T1_9MICO|nr:NAD(P)/FAD-dependent oxidoreductase [Georgenia yuyongxinii]QDC25121.1 NAD(P)/FAD-dependent oxidoreductase [Georgenia yuyongxinii]
MHIAIIGAGFAGLAAGKVLTQFGHEVTIYEKAPDVGGVWSSTRRYPGLSTQNNKGTYALPDLPMPKHFPEWPSGEQVQQYLEAYARKFALLDRTRLSTEVIGADLDESGPRWTIRTRGPAGEVHESADFVVVANGIFSDAFTPSYPGRDEFEAAGGRVCTPSDVRDLAQVEGKHVVVVGYGKSACDIATAISGSAATTSVVARQLIWKMPKKLLGVLNYKYLMLTRLGEALFEYQQTKGVEAFLHGKGKAVRDGMLSGLQAVATKQLRLTRSGLVPVGGFERIARSTVSLTSDSFFKKAASGEIDVVRDSQIVRLFEQGGLPMAELADGSTRRADVVIAATGWRQGVPFLSPEIQDRLTDERGNFELYRFVLPHDVPGLAFCGYNSSFYSPLSAEVAALWIADYLMDGSNLPPVAERRRQVQQRLRWMEERTEGHHARGTNLIPFSMHNVDEMLAEIGIIIPRAQRVREWLLPANPRDYCRITEQLLARQQSARRDLGEPSLPRATEQPSAAQLADQAAGPVAEDRHRSPRAEEQPSTPGAEKERSIVN